MKAALSDTNLTSKTVRKYFSKPWYLQSWFIGINFALWFFILPGLVGVILVIVDYIETKKKGELIKNLNLDKLALLDNLERDIEKKIAEDETVNTYQELSKKLQVVQSEIGDTESAIERLSDRRIELEQEVEMQEYGFYNPEKDSRTSADHKATIVALQNEQKVMVKNKAACLYNPNYTFNGSLSEGKKDALRQVKIALWAFNTHCDNVIRNVTYRNRAISEKKITRAYELINEAFAVVNLTPEYLALKFKELEETHRYFEKVENEKELLRQEREKEREERKLQEDIKRERAKLEKDETHIHKEIERLKRMLNEEKTEKEAARKQIEQLNERLVEIDNKKQEVDYRENHAKAGYVYIISNLGAFGEDIIKIGVTRRLEPHDRITELGDASVPFRFDTHALVFSENAYELEAALHKKFAKQRLNKVNSRKEFFRVSLLEVKEAIQKEFNATLEFDDEKPAFEFRQSLLTK